MARSVAPELTADTLIGEDITVEDAETQEGASPAAETPPVETAPTVEEDAPPVEVAAEEDAPLEAEAEDAPPPEKPTGKFPWQELRRAQKEREELTQRIAAMERERAQVRPPQPTAPALAQDLRPGIDRPYTREELVTLRADDPIEYAAVVAEQSQYMAQVQEQRSQMMMVQQMVARQVDEYKAEHPDYTEAARFAGERERAAWVAIGLPEQAPAHQPRADGGCCADHMVEARTAMLIQQSLNNGKNVAENVMAVAKAYGWQGNGGTAKEVVAPPPVGLSPQEKVAASKAKTAASMGSVGNIPGGPTKSRTRITATEFKDMTEADMERRDREDPNWMDYLDL